MSRFRMQAWLATACLASASAVAQEHRHDAMEDAPQAMQDHAMQMTDGVHKTPASSQAARMDHAAMSHDDMETGAMNHQAMDHAWMDHSKMDHTRPTNTAITGNLANTGSTALPREPIPTPTADDIAAAFAPLQSHAMHSAGINHYVLVDRLEASNTDRGSGRAWESRAWIGGDIDRALAAQRRRAARRAHRIRLAGSLLRPCDLAVVGSARRRASGHRHRRTSQLGGLRRAGPGAVQVRNRSHVVCGQRQPRSPAAGKANTKYC